MRYHTSISSTAIAALCLACAADGPGSDPRASARPYPVELSPPEHGIQVQTVGREIPAGADEEWCELVELPGDPEDTYLVGRLELAMAPFSHHLIVSFAPADSARLAAEPLGEPVRCAGATSFGSDLATLTTSAMPYRSDALPSGVGYVLHGGQRLVFDYHALNTSEAAVPAAHRLNLHVVDRIDKQAQVFGFYNQYIEIPPFSTRSFTDQCVLKDDVLVWSLSRHTHRRGTSFDVSWVGGEQDGQHLWTSTSWDEDITFQFDEPLVMRAGAGFRWQCAFDNPTEETLVFGPEATDEMCILFGQYAAVGDEESAPPQSCYRFTPSPEPEL